MVVPFNYNVTDKDILGKIVILHTTSDTLNNTIGQVTGRYFETFLGEFLYEVSFYYAHPNTGEIVRSRCDAAFEEMFELDMETGAYNV